MLVLHSERHPTNHSSLSKENKLCPSHREWMGRQAGARTEKPIPATSDTYQMPVMQGEATPHSGQKAGGPRRPILIL